MKQHFCGPVIALLAVLAGGGGTLSAAPTSVPFHAKALGQVIGAPTRNPDLYSVELSGSGNGSQLGKFTLFAQHTTNVLTGAITGGSITFTTANGDQVYGTYTGNEFPTDSPDVVTAEGIIAITGGTGRFMGAYGSTGFSADVVVDEITGQGVFLESLNASFSGRLSFPRL